MVAASALILRIVHFYGGNFLIVIAGFRIYGGILMVATPSFLLPL